MRPEDTFSATDDTFSSTSGRRRRGPFGAVTRILMLLVMAFAALLLTAAPASAHLGLGSSDPADGARLTTAPASVRLVFTKPADPVGDGGLRLLDERGIALPASAVSAEAGATWILTPRRPLASGRYRLAWKVVAADAHIRTGVLRFTVTGSGAKPATTGPADAGAAGPAASGEADHGAGHGGHHVTTLAQAGASPADREAGDDDLADVGADETGWPAQAPQWLGWAGRCAGVIGVLIAVGALVVGVTTLVGSEGDVRLTGTVVRLGAALAAIGAVAETASLALTVGTAVPVSAAAAVGARFVGAVVLVTAGQLVPRRTGGRRSHDVQALPPMPSAADAGQGPGSGRGRLRTAQLVLDRPLLAPPVQVGRVRPVVERPVPVLLAGVLLIGSFALDGHTASTGPHTVMITADLIHTTGAAVWAGGVVLLGCLLLVRARAGIPTGAGELAVRFSVPASAAAAAVGGAGAVMLTLIVEDAAQLLTTPWGRAMTAKLVLVTVVALLGYANNRYAVPALDAWQPHTARLLRRTVAVEACVMACVMAVTAVLVVSGM